MANRRPHAQDGSWCGDVLTALTRLGGRARLSRLYDEVRTIRIQAGRSAPRSYEAIIRRTLEAHSSDSDNFRGHYDLFTMPEGKGAGLWSIR